MRECALLHDWPVFTEKVLWNADHLLALQTYFINQSDEGTFFDKLKGKLAGMTAVRCSSLANGQERASL